MQYDFSIRVVVLYVVTAVCVLFSMYCIYLICATPSNNTVVWHYLKVVSEKHLSLE